jgi:hypothetical protein
MKRILKLNRNRGYFSRTSIGELLVEGKEFGVTLEDTCRPYGVKVYGETAISENMNSEGYKLGIHNSPTFGEVLIVYTEDDKVTLKYGGISFKYTYFHGLNSHEETLGCIGIGKHQKGDKIYNSLRKELEAIVFPWIKAGDDVRLFIQNFPQQK